MGKEKIEEEQKVRKYWLKVAEEEKKRGRTAREKTTKRKKRKLCNRNRR